jgi:hypothetical protein
MSLRIFSGPYLRESSISSVDFGATNRRFSRNMLTRFHAGLTWARRAGGLMRYWWVNQNQTCRQEEQGGFLWSPKTDAHGEGIKRGPFKPRQCRVLEYHRTSVFQP